MTFGSRSSRFGGWRTLAGSLAVCAVAAATTVLTVGSVNASVALQSDNAHGARPGGDRLGFQVQAGGVILTDSWRIRPQLGYSSWDSESVFAPALLDVKRRNRLTQASLQGERPLNESTSLVLEWRGKRHQVLYRPE